MVKKSAKKNNGLAKRTITKLGKSSVVSPLSKKTHRGPGKPRRKFTPAQITQMEEYAFSGCLNCTIATLMDIPATTLDSRKDIRKKLTKKRAERKAWLRQNQNHRVTHDVSPVMAIFLGKNELGQADKQEISHSGSFELKEPVIK